MENSGVGVVVLDRLHRYVFVNEVASEINGIPVDAHLDRLLSEVLPHIGPSMAPILDQVLGSGVALLDQEVEGETPAQPGTTRTWLVNYVPLRVGPAVDGVVVVFSETTRLRRAETRLRTLIDGLFTFVGLLSPDGTLIEANQTALEAADLAAGDVVGLPFWEAYWWTHDVGVQQRLRAAVEAAAAGSSCRYDEVIRVAGARLITIDFQLSPIIEDGSVIAIVPSGLDVTHRVEAGRQSAAFARLAREVNRAQRPDDVAEYAAGGAAEAVGGIYANVALVDVDRRTLRIVNPPSTPSDLAEAWSEVPLDADSPFHEVLETGEPVVIADQRERAERYPALVEPSERLGFGATAAMPLQRSDGTVFGVLGVAWPTSGPPTDGHQHQLRALTDLVAQAVERSRLSHARHELVEELQRELLPVLPDVPGLSTAVHYASAASDLGLGGDWYDVVLVDDHRVALLIGDLAGHGVHAAARMAQVNTVLGTLLRQEVPLSELFMRANALLRDRHDSFIGTAAVVVVDVRNHVAEYVLAGHPPVLLQGPDGHVVWLEDGRLPVLGQATRAVRPGLVATPPGSTLILYTDGLVESPENGIDDGIRAVATAAGRASDPSNPGHVLANIVKLLSTGALRDDAAIIVATVDR